VSRPIAAIFLGLIIAGTATVPAVAQGHWATKTPMPGGPRENTGVVAFDGRMYVLGGNAFQDTQITRTEVYDPATGTWSARAPMPRGSHHIAATLLNGKIYTFGGFTGQAHALPVDNAFEYDLKANAWRELPKLSSPRGSPSAVALDGKIHLIGGRGPDNKTIGNHEVFDPTTGTWSQRAPLAKPRDHLGMIVINGKIHVIGGRPVSFASNETMHEIYDLATNTWIAAAPMPTARSSVATAEYRGMIVVAGGEGEQAGPGSAISGQRGLRPQDRQVDHAHADAIGQARHRRCRIWSLGLHPRGLEHARWRRRHRRAGDIHAALGVTFPHSPLIPAKAHRR
jgi:N-acetylneuraminic acid mutarotase